MRRWLLPAAMVTVATAVVLELLSVGTSAVIASTSVASTAFVLFTAPGSPAARPWNTLLGHGLGLIAGVAVLPLAQAGLALPLVYALSVGLSVALMQQARASHPPAAGTALTVPAAWAHGGFSPSMAAVILLTVAGLQLMQRLMRPWLAEGD